MDRTVLRILICCSLFCLQFTEGSAFSADAKSHKCGGGKCGQPLFMTPYIELGRISEARNLSKVGTLPNAPNVDSYSGFFTVNQFYGYLFFWFFPAMNGNTSAPLLLWLNGGPGSSSLMGLFLENGPYVIDSNMDAKLRPTHWAQKFQVLYIDNPVGSGFSFTVSDSGYATNQSDVSRDLYDLLQQFFIVFPEYRNNEFYITGESYAGKYVPALAYKIHTEGNSSKINLKGIAIGNGMSDPETMLDYHDYFYQLGLIDRKQYTSMKALSESIVRHIRKEEYYEAVVGLRELVIDFRTLPYASNFTNYTGYHFLYNHLQANEPSDFKYFESYIELPDFRRAAHVGNLPFNDGLVVQKHLLLDIMKSVKPLVAVLMDNYKVLFYSGQLDLCIPYPLTVNFLNTVHWKHQKQYKNAKREIWRLKETGEIAGYVHNVGDFYEVLVRNAGHLVPHDQPEFALDLITRFIYQQPFSS